MMVRMSSWCAVACLVFSVAACGKKGAETGPAKAPVTKGESHPAKAGGADEAPKVDQKAKAAQADETAKSDKTADGAKAAKADQDKAKADGDGVKRSAGVAEAGNTAKLVELVKAFSTCDLKDLHPEWACREAYKPFIAAVDEARDLETLFNFLDDEDPHSRFAAALALKDTMAMQGKAAAPFQRRLLAVAERETDPAVAEALSHSILQGVFSDEAYREGVKKLVASHPLAAMRAAVVSNLPVHDWDTFFPFLKERLAKEKDPAVRKAIIKSFYLTANKPGACDLFEATLDDPDPEVAAAAAYDIVWTSGNCKDKYDAFLAHFEKRVAAKKADFSYQLQANYMAQAPGASDAQKARFIKSLKAIVEDTELGDMDRQKALATVGEYAPDGRAYAKKFLHDKSSMVASEAKSILKGK